MMAVIAPRLPAYMPFHSTFETWGILLQRTHSFSPFTCGRITLLSMLGRSVINQFSPRGLSHFARHNFNGTRTWSMMGTDAMRSAVFGGPTLPCEGLLRLMC